jgi:hypothetical protein
MASTINSFDSEHQGIVVHNNKLIIYNTSTM